MKQHLVLQRIIILAICCTFSFILTIGLPSASFAMRKELSIPMYSKVTTSVQETPTVDPTVIALQKEQLEHNSNWFWNNGSTLLSVLAIISTALFTTLFGLWRWQREQQIDREKRDEERFQKVVEGLGSERIEAKVGAAIMLRTFLRPNYKQFYRQAFDLAVAQLRPSKPKSEKPEPPDALHHALIIVIKESFSLARDEIKQTIQFEPEMLDASYIQMDYAYLSKTDLEGIRMREASLREAHFWQSNLKKAYIKWSDLENAYLEGANLEEADLGRTNLIGANIQKANLVRAHLRHADLTRADLTGANLTETRPEGAKSLQGTIMYGVIGLTPEQISACMAKGAIFDPANQPSAPASSPSNLYSE